jgi:hypothetical protein
MLKEHKSKECRKKFQVVQLKEQGEEKGLGRERERD